MYGSWQEKFWKLINIQLLFGFMEKLFGSSLPYESSFSNNPSTSSHVLKIFGTVLLLFLFLLIPHSLALLPLPGQTPSSGRFSRSLAATQGLRPHPPSPLHSLSWDPAQRPWDLTALKDNIWSLLSFIHLLYFSVFLHLNVNCCTLFHCFCTTGFLYWYFLFLLPCSCMLGTIEWLHRSMHPYVLKVSHLLIYLCAHTRTYSHTCMYVCMDIWMQWCH